MIEMVSLLVAIVLAVFWHTYTCSPASLLKRMEQRDMNRILRRDIEMYDEILNKRGMEGPRDLELEPIQSQLSLLQLGAEEDWDTKDCQSQGDILSVLTPLLCLLTILHS